MSRAGTTGSPAPPSSRRHVWTLLILAFLIGGFWLRNRMFPPPPGPPEPLIPPVAELSAAQIAEIYRLRNVGISHLENEKIPDALSAFEQLARELPHEALPVQNIAVAQFLDVMKGGGTTSPSTLRETIRKFTALAPESPIPDWLLGNLASKEKSTETDAARRKTLDQEAVEAFLQATKKTPFDPVPWYELSLRFRDLEPPDLEQANAALSQAITLAGDNVFLVAEGLVHLARAKDTAVGPMISRATKVFAPLAEGVQARTRVNVMEYLARAESLLQDGEISKVLGAVQPVRNVVMGDEAFRSDSRRMALNALAFVAYEFSPEFQQRHPVPPVVPPPSDVRFEPRMAAGLESLSDVTDAQFVDFDLDNQPELAVLAAGALVILKHDRGSDEWKTMAQIELPPDQTRFLAADLDRDTVPAGTAAAAPAARATPDAGAAVPEKGTCFEADVDFVVFGSGGLSVVRNQLDAAGPRKLELVDPGPIRELRKIWDVALGDFDHDGDLDLLLGTDGGFSLWSNLENLTFTDTSSWSEFPPADLRFASMTVGDWDRDIDIDVWLTGKDGTPNGYLENLRHGQFRWRTTETQFLPDQDLTDLLLIEADGNASWDFVAIGKSGVRVELSSMLESGRVRATGRHVITEQAFAHGLDWDYDNDGFQDLLLWGEGAPTIARGLSGGQFVIEAGRMPELEAACERVDTGDWDGDGDLDLCLVAGGRVRLWINEGGNRNHWMTVQVRGENEDKSGRVNHNGIGSLLECKSGSRYQAQIVRRPVTHFGLGPSSAADVLRVLWTNGVPQAVVAPSIDQVVCEKQILKGSCPFLYAWDGSRFRFVTDCLWAAPIGLQLAPGVLAPARPWEYLKIEADQLQPRHEQYELRVTEELWEAAYFDQIRLLAVDHPSEIEIYSNEKVGPEAIAKFQLHTVRNRKQPVSAQDGTGRDLRELLARRDGAYAQTFATTLRQGIAAEHYLELDLGDLGDPRHITLFLTGWIRPTDTSLNVAVAQNPNVAAPRPPSLWVPDATGNWREAIAYTGFPGGKPKTIALDLSQVFPNGDYRLRLVSSQELYWDEAFFTIDEEPFEPRVTELELLGAELRYRGFSAPLPRGPQDPEEFDYDHCSLAPKWAPMGGQFTRYGEVRELLVASDDRLVILGAGDEIQLRFASLPAPPPGWRRDFVMHNVGWDKDADMHTVTGQTVEPFPFLRMKSYPYETEDYSTDSAWQHYFRRYQTRSARSAPFWRAVVSGDSPL